ncbi:hypothetical protein EVA_19243 [gut metagenome]|uniref:Uncharacterized protein n=1 Tax=gut metagenome TaxID=749906 RepID=J9FCN2_9ZZZZ
MIVALYNMNGIPMTLMWNRYQRIQFVMKQLSLVG